VTLLWGITDVDHRDQRQVFLQIQVHSTNYSCRLVGGDHQRWGDGRAQINAFDARTRGMS
jgi:hypothetical protein